jgi:tRNA modification GTPase
LFNALTERFGAAAASALVSPEPGVTRDWIVARLQLDGLPCELIDTAGLDERDGDALHRAAQLGAGVHARRAEIRLHCTDAAASDVCQAALKAPVAEGDLLVLTKIDLAPSLPAPAGSIGCSSKTGAGLGELVQALAQRLAELHGETSGAVAAALTAARCTESLNSADRALASALDALDAASDDLVAADLRQALHGIGQVVGAVYADDLLDVIFSKFCIGK